MPDLWQATSLAASVSDYGPPPGVYDRESKVHGEPEVSLVYPREQLHRILNIQNGIMYLDYNCPDTGVEIDYHSGVTSHF